MTTLFFTVLFCVAWLFILYTYVGFPLLLAGMANRARRVPPQDDAQPEPTNEQLPSVTMVVAAWNEASVLRQKLLNTAAIAYPADRFQLLIGSDGSDDGSAELLANCTDPRVRAVCFPVRRGKISVLNDLMGQCDSDIVVMSDANSMYAPDAVRRLVHHFRDELVGCVSGELRLERDGGVSGEGLYWKYEGWIKRNESRLGFLVGCNGGIFALRRSLYEPLPASTIVEDFVLTLRVLERGFRVVFDPEATAVEPASPSSQAEMRRKIRIGAGGFQALGLTSRLLHPRRGAIAFAYWGHKVLRWLVPLFMLAALVANFALLSHPLSQAALLTQALGGVIGGWAYFAPAEKGVPRWARPIGYFYLMNWALFCGFLRYLFRTQRVTWDRAVA